jgi:hypothetical protein
MATAKKPMSRGGKTVGKRPGTGEPAAVARLNKSLDAAQDALAALRNDVHKDVSTGARDIYKDVQKFVKDARRDSGNLARPWSAILKRLRSGSRLPREPRARAAPAHDAKPQLDQPPSAPRPGRPPSRREGLALFQGVKAAAKPATVAAATPLVSSSRHPPFA